MIIFTTSWTKNSLIINNNSLFCTILLVGRWHSKGYFKGSIRDYLLIATVGMSFDMLRIILVDHIPVGFCKNQVFILMFYSDIYIYITF